jgi:hypothetical protein
MLPLNKAWYQWLMLLLLWRCQIVFDREITGLDSSANPQANIRYSVIQSMIYGVRPCFA